MMTFNNGATGAFDDCYTAKLQRSDLTPTYFSYLNMGAGSVDITTEAECGGVIDSNNPNILYFGGNTESPVAFAGAPASVLGFQPTFHGTEDAFVMKLDTSVSGTGSAEICHVHRRRRHDGGEYRRASNWAPDWWCWRVARVRTARRTRRTFRWGIHCRGELRMRGLVIRWRETGFVTVMDTTKSGAASLISGSYFGGSSGGDQIRALGYDALISDRVLYHRRRTNPIHRFSDFTSISSGALRDARRFRGRVSHHADHGSDGILQLHRRGNE